MSSEYTFDSRSGHIRKNNALIGWGYSGFGSGLLNPADEYIINIGPIPRGEYTLELIQFPSEGPVVFNLKASESTNLHGRSGFHLHWDNRSHNFTASRGCIVIVTTWLFSIFQHGDIIKVIAL